MSSRRVTLSGRTALVGLLALGLSGCSWIDQLGGGEELPTGGPSQVQVTRQNIVAPAGMPAAAVPAAGVAVNAFLWRAALDTVSFMPVTQADPYGGVILTDWYTPPATPGERFKVNLYILDAALRADGVRATVFRQVQQGGFWTDAPVAAETATQMEDTILTRARQLRQASSPSN